MNQIITAILGNPDTNVQLKALTELIAIQVKEDYRQALQVVLTEAQS